MLINFFGKRGSGKTTVIEGQLQDCRGPVVVADILGNYTNSNYVQADTTEEGILEIENYLNDPKKENKIIVVKCPDPDFTVDYLSAALWEAEQGTLVLDEADGFSLANAPCFDQLVRYGRNKNIDLITGCRRPAEISRNITAGANKLFVFQTQEPRDVEYFRTTLFGERAEELMNLDEYHGLYIDYDLKTIGNYYIDIKGQIFIIDSEPLRKPKNPTNEELEE